MHVDAKTAEVDSTKRTLAKVLRDNDRMQNSLTKLASTIEAKDEIITLLKKELRDNKEQLAALSDESTTIGDAFLEEQQKTTRLQNEVELEVTKLSRATAEHEKILDELRGIHSTELVNVKKQLQDDLSRKTLEFDGKIADANIANAGLEEQLRNEKAQSERKLDIAAATAKQLEVEVGHERVELNKQLDNVTAAKNLSLQQFDQEKLQFEGSLEFVRAAKKQVQDELNQEQDRVRDLFAGKATSDKALELQLEQMELHRQRNVEADDHKTRLHQEALAKAVEDISALRSQVEEARVSLGKGRADAKAKMEGMSTQWHDERAMFAASIEKLEKDIQGEKASRAFENVAAIALEEHLRKDFKAIQLDLLKERSSIKELCLELESYKTKEAENAQRDQQLVEPQDRERSQVSTQDLVSKPHALRAGLQRSIAIMREPLKEINARQSKKRRVSEYSDPEETLEKSRQEPSGRAAIIADNESLQSRTCQWEVVCKDLYNMLSRFEPINKCQVDFKVAIGLIVYCFSRHQLSYTRFQAAIEGSTSKKLVEPSWLCLLLVCTGKSHKTISENAMCRVCEVANLCGCIRIQQDKSTLKKVMFNFIKCN